MLARRPGGLIAEKMGDTCEKHHGVRNAFASKKLQRKIRSTMLERHGVDSPQKSQNIRMRTKATCRARYGVDVTSQCPRVKAKMRQTCIERHGAPTMFQTSGFFEKAIKVWRKKYGVDNPMKHSDVARKNHEAKKASGTFAKSAAEDRFFEFLTSTFDSVERQVHVNCWYIDFYIPSIDTYVQFDGVYWHGLDRPLDIIAELKDVRDASILAAHGRDREQDVWFDENNLRLVRVTDLQFSSNDASVVLDVLRR